MTRFVILRASYCIFDLIKEVHRLHTYKKEWLRSKTIRYPRV